MILDFKKSQEKMRHRQARRLMEQMERAKADKDLDLNSDFG
jgi:hypothetical protein